MRHEVDQLLLALWADPSCKTSLVALATESGTSASAEDASGGVLVDYARAVLNDLMYLLKVSTLEICKGADGGTACVNDTRSVLNDPLSVSVALRGPSWISWESCVMCSATKLLRCMEPCGESFLISY